MDKEAERKYFERAALDERLRMDKDADPVIIIESMDKLAEINFQVLTETNSLAHKIHQTLAKGSQYPLPGQSDLPDQYSTLKDSLNSLIDHVGKITWHNYNPHTPDDHRKVLAALDGAIKPNIDTLHNLFRSGYHRPSPLPSSMTESEVNVLSMLDRFSAHFTEPVKRVSHLLAGGSKPQVKIGSVETVEELVRVLHDVGLSRYKHIFHDIIHQEHYGHIKRVTVSRGGYHAPHIQGLGYSDIKKFQKSPMWQIAEAMIEYSKEDHSKYEDTFRDSTFSRMYALMTTHSLSAAMDLDYGIVGDTANASLHVMHDPKHDSYSIAFHCGNKGYFSHKFMEAILSSFQEEGYKCTNGDWGTKAFWVDTRSTGDQAKKDVRFMFDNLTDKLRNVNGW